MARYNKAKVKHCHISFCPVNVVVCTESESHCRWNFPGCILVLRLNLLYRIYIYI